MSDLQCAATVVVVRHAEAEYDLDTVSDAGGSLTQAGREQARRLGESLRERRVSAIWCSDMARAVQTAEIAASVVGCGVRVRAGLREFGVGDHEGAVYPSDLLSDVLSAWRSGRLDVGCPGAETGADVVRRFSDEMEAVGDLHRGETVLVVSHAGVMRLVLGRLARNVADTLTWAQPLNHCAGGEMVVDADGWVLRTWVGEPVEPVEPEGAVPPR